LPRVAAGYYDRKLLTALLLRKCLSGLTLRFTIDLFQTYRLLNFFFPNSLLHFGGWLYMPKTIEI
ncbi:MAG: hypothetical protein V3T17_12785, partial [Pseudomonadales bacterium]